MAAAARRDGVALRDRQRVSLRRRAGRAVARHPDPERVAPPGQSLHRNGTELDLGPRGAYAWLAANAGRFHFLRRYFRDDLGTTAVRLHTMP